MTSLSNFGEVTPRFGSFQFDLTPGFWDVLASPYDAGVGAFHRTDREPTSAAPRSILHDAPGLPGVDLVAFWSQILTSWDLCFCLSLSLFRCMSHLTSPRWNTSRLMCLVGIRPLVAMHARRMSDFSEFLLILVGFSARFFA